MELTQRQRGCLERAGLQGEGVLGPLSAGHGEVAAPRMWAMLEHCRSFKDCTDFKLNDLLRALLLFAPAVPADVRECLRDTALAARYYGGHCERYPMFYSSENHHLNWAVAEHLTAQTYPDATFGYDGRSSQDHLARSRLLIANWIDCRARFGFNEWNSSPYMVVNLQSLLNLVDFAADAAVRQLAHDAVTKLLADVAADSAGGAVWSAQARIYQQQLFGKAGQRLSTTFNLLLGCGSDEDLPHGGDDPAVTTSYRAPAWLCDLANDLSRPMVNRERHRVEQDVYYKCRSLFWRPPVELINEADRQRLAPASLHEFAVYTERRREYLASAALLPTSYTATHGHQTLMWMGCLQGRLPIFAIQPSGKVPPQGPDSYWVGAYHIAVPRCYLQDGVLAAVYPGDSGSFIHAHFPTTDFDQSAQEGGWWFGRLGDGFVALLPPAGAKLTDSGPWAGKELIAPGEPSAWVVVFGSEAQDGSWSNFMARCQAMAVTFDADDPRVRVQGSGVEFAVSYHHGTRVGGRPLSYADWKQMDNPVVRQDWGSPLMQVTTAQGPATIDFSAARDMMAACRFGD